MKKGITIALIAVCAVVFCVSAWQLISYYGADRAAEKAFEELLPEELGSPDVALSDAMSYEALAPYYEKLREENGDFAGWLRIPGTRVSYPVMQTPKSPEYYLDKTFKKEYSASGSLFASSICSVTLPSDVVTIYGHRMKTGAMFGSLGDYLKEDFMRERDTVIFDTFAGRSEYKVYSVFSLAVDTNDESEFDYYNYNMFADKDAYDRFMTHIRALSQAENPSYAPVFGDKILLLSTCEYTHENGRLVLVCVRVL